MHWTSWSQFLSMGGYGSYVWGSYGVTFVLLAGEVLMLRKRKRDFEKKRISPRLKTRTSNFETASS